MSASIDRYPVVRITSIACGVGGSALAWIDCGDARALVGALISYCIGLSLGALIKWSVGLVNLLFWPPVSEPANEAPGRVQRVGGILGRITGIVFLTVILHEAHWIINLASLFNVGLELASDLNRAEAEKANNAIIAIMGGAPRQPLSDKEPMTAAKPSVYSARPLCWLVRGQGHEIIGTFAQVQQITANKRPEPRQVELWMDFLRQTTAGQQMTRRDFDELSAAPRLAGTIVLIHMTMAEMHSVLQRTWFIRHIPDVDKVLKSIEKDWQERKAA